MSKSLRQVVAANMRRLRVVTPAQPEDVARAAGQFGLEWTANWVASVEKGQKAISAEQLLALPFVLAIALGHRVSLADLLLSDEPVELGKPGVGMPLNPQYLRDIITGIPVRRSFVDAPGAEESASPPPRAVQAAEKARIITQANLGHVDMRALKRAEDGASDAETKLAKKLGVPEVVVIAAAAVLWGRSLTEERDQELADTGLAKTVVTRKLTTTLTSVITEAAEGTLQRPALSALAAPTMSIPIIAISPPPAPAPPDYIEGELV